MILGGLLLNGGPLPGSLETRLVLSADENGNPFPTPIRLEHQLQM